MQAVEEMNLKLIGTKCIIKAVKRGDVTYKSLILPDLGVLSQGVVIHSSIPWLEKGDKVEFDKYSAFGLFDLDPDGDYHVVNEAGILGVYDEEGELQPSPGRSVVCDVQHPTETGEHVILPDNSPELINDVVKALVVSTRIKELVDRWVLFRKDQGFICYEKLPEWREIRVIDDEDILAVLEE